MDNQQWWRQADGGGTRGWVHARVASCRMLSFPPNCEREAAHRWVWGCCQDQAGKHHLRGRDCSAWRGVSPALAQAAQKWPLDLAKHFWASQGKWIKGEWGMCSLVETGICPVTPFEVTPCYCSDFIALSPLHSISHWNLFREVVRPRAIQSLVILHAQKCYCGLEAHN